MPVLAALHPEALTPRLSPRYRTYDHLDATPTIEPETAFAAVIGPDLVRREPKAAKTSSPFATKSCGPNDSRDICQRPVNASSTTTLPIVLGVVIPLTAALVIFVFLHRRHVRKLRTEDANDKHKSLDFGMGQVNSPEGKHGKKSKSKPNVPQMSLADTEKTLGRRGQGLSMDLDMSMSSPYMLPPELQQSRESLHSLTRTMNTGDDKYRTAASFLPGEGPLSRAGSRMGGGDDSSSYTSSTRHAYGEKEKESNAGLLRHAQRMSRSMPPTGRASASSLNSVPAIQVPEQAKLSRAKSPSPPPIKGGLAPASSGADRDSYLSDISKDGHTAGLRKSNDYLSAFIRRGGLGQGETQSTKQPEQEVETAAPSPPANDPAPTIHQPTPVAKFASLPKVESDPEPLKFDFPDFDKRSAEEPAPNTSSQQTDSRESIVDSQQSRQELDNEAYEQDFDYDVRRLTMGIRPLPPDDPTEDPEQRANRIRSFYKEYFDDSKQAPVFTQEDYQMNAENWDYNGYEDYSGNQHGQGYAHPPVRRMLTPQPRGHSSLQGQHRMVASTSSGPFMQGGPRAYSSQSGRFGGPPRGPAKKKGPPPAPLQVLPTPHLLKDDTMIPMDFAPPTSIRAQRSGTPDSLRGGHRPYSPALPAYLPLASSFDDLAVMPSPHALRKSGTFTALDFAPPRFRSNTDARSDAGSIRSNKSGMSAAQLHTLRSGAYRVSRIPQGLGGTKQEFADSLKPQWDMRK